MELPAPGALEGLGGVLESEGDQERLVEHAAEVPVGGDEVDLVDADVCVYRGLQRQGRGAGPGWGERVWAARRGQRKTIAA